MFLNWLLLPTWLLGMALYWLGHTLSTESLQPRVRTACILGASLLCLPGISFILYYLHLIREPAWYIEFRSIPGIETSAAFLGLPLGAVEIKRPLVGIWRYLAGNRMMLRLSLLLMFVPFAKPVLLPFIGVKFEDAWKDGVCLQSTQATCGPCSLATVYRSLGASVKERDIARESFSGLTGTENWYLIRYARRHGLDARIGYKTSLDEVTPPAIIGVQLDGGAGHFITYLGDEGERRIIGDPLSGRLLLTDEVFRGLYSFSGMAMEFQASPGAPSSGGSR